MSGSDHRDLLLASLVCALACSPAAESQPPKQAEPASAATSARPTSESKPLPQSEAGQSCTALASKPPDKPADVLKAPIPAIERTEALAQFVDALAALERKRRTEPVRIGIWGDSNLTLDEVSGALRRVLQRRFGDAGHGFIGIGNPWRGYRHMDVRRTLIGHWETYIFTRGQKPKRGGFGAAGMAAMTAEARARIRIETAEPGAPVGTAASRVGVFFLKQPGGGSFSIEVDGRQATRVATAAESESVGYELVKVADGPHRFEIVSLEQQKPVQLYGAALERDVPGVIVDAFGVTGATFGGLAALDPSSIRPMLEKRRHDLVVFALGTNFWNSDENPEGLRRLVELFRGLDPKRALLVMTPPDHVKTVHHTQSDPRVLRVVEQLESAAVQNRTALWDFREAMGGDGAMWVFHQRGLAGKDLYHLTATGARIMGERFAHAVQMAYHEHVTNEPRSGCE